MLGNVKQRITRANASCACGKDEHEIKEIEIEIAKEIERLRERAEKPIYDIHMDTIRCQQTAGKAKAKGKLCICMCILSICSLR